MERKYVDTFDRYFNSWKGWAVARIINSIASSAPESEKIIQTRRQERINTQNLRAKAREAKRIEDFKRRKAEGIAANSGSKSKQQGADQTELLNQHQANQNKIQELGLAHHKQMQEATLKFGQDMQNAKTDEERHVIQQEYQKNQQQKMRELQETLMKLKTQQGNYERDHK